MEEDLDGLRLTLADGSLVQGEVVTMYDHRLWWDASEQSTRALFDPAAWAPWPDDRSLRFVSDLDILSEEQISLGGAAPYEESVREQGVSIQAMPLDVDGPALVIMGNEGYHLEEDGYGDHAWDLVLTDPDGRRFTGTGAHNADYRVWDVPVRLPSPGVVVEIVRDAPDNFPGAYPEGAVNNLVGVWLGGQLYLYLLHFRQGSIPEDLEVGQALRAGTVLGRVGNSGVSLEPHLHLTVMYYDTHPVGEHGTVRTWSVPSQWSGMWSASSPQGPATQQTWSQPATGTWIDDQAF